MLTDERRDAFLDEYRALCERHGLYVGDDGYDSEPVVEESCGPDEIDMHIKHLGGVSSPAESPINPPLITPGLVTEYAICMLQRSADFADLLTRQYPAPHMGAVTIRKPVGVPTC